MRLLLHWLLIACALLVVAHFLPGFRVDGLGAALIAALVIGLLNATLGAVLKLFALPLTILTLGLFLLVINAVVLVVASHLAPGFHVSGLIPALYGAAALAVLGVLIRACAKRV